MDAEGGIRKGTGHIQVVRGNQSSTVLMNNEMEEKLEQLEIGDNIDSDYHPLIVWLKERGNRKSGRKRGKKEWKGV